MDRHRAIVYSVKRHPFQVFLLFVFLAITVALPVRADTGLPSGPIPAGLGVNIHFTHTTAAEMKLLASSGITWVRMDFFWAGIETKAGVYDFSSYDLLLSDLDANHIRALFILDYGNPLYQKDSPSTDDARAAFATFAAASVNHFAGRGVIWEMWNEPNGSFWKPKANAADYARLAIAAGKAIHAAQPAEIFIGPATSGVDLRFCEICFKSGCLDDWAAVSVHPYRQKGPESVVEDYRKLSGVISRNAPGGKAIPIISGEWGWSTGWKNLTPDMQADFLARQWLINQWQHVPLSIYYDWHDDGTNPKDPEHHFGMVDNAYQPKPAYLAARTLTTQLNGFSFNRRLPVGRSDDYVMLFTKGDQTRLAVWSTAKQPQVLSIPTNPGGVTVMSETGTELPELQAAGEMVSVTASSSPQYLIPAGR